MNTVHTESLTIHVDGHTSKSYLAYPAGQEQPLPGILVMPEFWGLTTHIKDRASRLAEAGYTTLAIDLYGEGFTPRTAEEGTSRMRKLLSDMTQTTKHLKAYLEALKDLKQTKTQLTASMGHCLGGALSLHLARIGADINGAVSFHGSLRDLISSSAYAKSIKTKMLVLHGEKDQMISKEQVQYFKKQMDSIGADYKFIEYPDAEHGFTNPQATANGKTFNIPTAYNESADKSSWKEMLSFLANTFSS